MFAEDGIVHIIKGLMTFDAFLEAYKPHKIKACCLHFRIATHGDVNELNTHPFHVTDTLGLVHNGIISNIKCDIDKNRSDTWHFTQKVVKPLASLWRNPAYKTLVEHFIGFSKLIVMNGEGTVEIYNEGQGHWNSECWFSNHSYVTKKYEPNYAFQGKKYNRDKDIWLEGDLATTNWAQETVDNKTIPKNSLVEIETFGHGLFMFVKYVEIGTPYYGLRAKISNFGLTKASYAPLKVKDFFALNMEVMFSKNYNHFRIGDKGIITSLAKDNVLLIDPLSMLDNKSYLVPKTSISPLLSLLN
jgi:hypothetical protein